MQTAGEFDRNSVLRENTSGENVYLVSARLKRLDDRENVFGAPSLHVDLYLGVVHRDVT